MKLNSKYFDSIRIKSGAREAPETKSDEPKCEWRGCDRAGQHRAPKGRDREGEFYLFCRDHVRQFNASYNYFQGMSDAQVEDYQKDAAYGHRPTWKVGENAYVNGERRPATDADMDRVKQSRGTDAQGFHTWRARQARDDARRPQRKLKPIEKKSLKALGLAEGADKDEIKTRFKALVKRHHPDANGGDRGSEEKLREIIQAYNYLKRVGLV
ncbi:MAG: J domain-containing protein [Hyphomicrobiaceae bacterium]